MIYKSIENIEAAQNLLFKYFEENNVFNLEKDVKNIVKISEDRELDAKIFRNAIAAFEESKLVAQVGDSTWILKKPINAYNQNVTISYATAVEMGEILSRCFGIMKVPLQYDPINVSEKDVLNLIDLLKVMTEEKK